MSALALARVVLPLVATTLIAGCGGADGARSRRLA